MKYNSVIHPHIILLWSVHVIIAIIPCLTTYTVRTLLHALPLLCPLIMLVLVNHICVIINNMYPGTTSSYWLMKSAWLVGF